MNIPQVLFFWHFYFYRYLQFITGCHFRLPAICFSVLYPSLTKTTVTPS